MENKKMIEARALFLQTVAWLLDTSMTLDDRFSVLLDAFLENYLYEYMDYFKLIYDISFDEEGTPVFHEEDEWAIPLNMYLSNFLDPKKTIMLYNDLGEDIVSKITSLAELFYDYIDTLIDMSINVKIKQ